jgi:hypothetical protein
VQCRGTRPNPRRLLSPVSDVSFGQRRESGFIPYSIIIQGAESPAKTVTSLLIIPSVLGYRRSLLISQIEKLFMKKMFKKIFLEQ